MKIWVHHYTLQPAAPSPRAARTPHDGALLKVEFDDDIVGFSDLHPWQEFGHHPLHSHLVSLKENAPSHLASLALSHAKIDAAARDANLSLFQNLPTLSSHALFTNWLNAPLKSFEKCAADGYTIAKLKIGSDPSREVSRLNSLAHIPLRWRLDANASFPPDGYAFSQFLSALSPAARQNIDFIEDPCPFSLSVWTSLASLSPLAFDWQLPSLPFAPLQDRFSLVVKPASQDAATLAVSHGNTKIVITHSMDHPLGQSVALWSAMHLRHQGHNVHPVGGFQAIDLYQPDLFSEQIISHGPSTSPPPGTGFGFDDLLPSLPWRKLDDF